MDWCKCFVRKDKHGQVAATGVAWTEYNAWGGALDMLIDIVCIVGGFVMTFGGLLASVNSGGWLLVTLIGIASCVLPAVRNRVDVWRTPRSMIFHRDGRVEMPSGFPYHPQFLEMSQPHGEIVSIEARVAPWQLPQNPFRHDVAVYRRDGDIVHVARLLRADEAHKVAVQLSLALNDMRSALANAAGAQGAARGAQQPRHGVGSRIEVLID